jgi:serine/threonine protein phosphatase PrpC
MPNSTVQAETRTEEDDQVQERKKLCRTVSVAYKRQLQQVDDDKRTPSKLHAVVAKPGSSASGSFFGRCLEGILALMPGKKIINEEFLNQAADMYRKDREVLPDLPGSGLCKNWEDLTEAEQQAYGGLKVAIGTQCKEDKNSLGWINQDSVFACVLPSHDDDDESSAPPVLVGVFDGHGHFGHEASQIVATRLPGYLAMSEKSPLKEPKAAFEAAFRSVDADVYKGLGPDIEFSGSTAVVALIGTLTNAGRKTRVAHLANVGDSRAIMGQHCKGKYQAQQLTEDLKPDSRDERRRIEKSGGVIAKCRADGVHEIGGFRVWDDSSCEKPGLAMSRSLGDSCARTVGVSGEPVVTTHTIAKDDTMMVLASDGVWDSLPNEKVLSTAGKFLSTSLLGAVKGIIGAVRREEDGNCPDDTTVVLVKF